MIYDLAARFFEISEMFGECDVEHREGSRGNFYEPGEPEVYILHYDILMVADLDKLTDNLTRNEVVEVFKKNLDLTKYGYFEEYFGEDLGEFLKSFNSFPKEVFDIELCSCDIFEDKGYLNIKIYACVQGI